MGQVQVGIVMIVVSLVILAASTILIAVFKRKEEYEYMYDEISGECIRVIQRS